MNVYLPKEGDRFRTHLLGGGTIDLVVDELLVKLDGAPIAIRSLAKNDGRVVLIPWHAIAFLEELPPEPTGETRPAPGSIVVGPT